MKRHRIGALTPGLLTLTLAVLPGISFVPKPTRLQRQSKGRTNMYAVSSASWQGEGDVAFLMQQARRLRAEAQQLQDEANAQREKVRVELFNKFKTQGSNGIDAHGLHKLLHQHGFRTSIEIAQELIAGYDEKGKSLKLKDFDLRTLLRMTVGAEADQQEKSAIERRVLEKIKKRIELLGSLPLANMDFSWRTRLLSALPYTVPSLDGLRFAFEKQLLEPNPYYVEASSDPNFTCIMGLLQFGLCMMMSVVACNRRLALVVRFNLNQAYVLQLLFWLYYTCTEPLEGTDGATWQHHAGLSLLFISIFYSVASSLAGHIPSGIPFISREAQRSLGKIRLPKRDA